MIIPSPHDLVNVSSCHPVLVETSLYKPVGSTIVPARTEPFKASDFYWTRSGLYLGDGSNFEDSLDLDKIVDSAPERPYVALLLKMNVYNKEIRKELAENHLSAPEDIAALIKAQPAGKFGFLLSNRRLNIFFVRGKYGEIFVMRVEWSSCYHEWILGLSKLDQFGYLDAGRQIICPGTAVL